MDRSTTMWICLAAAFVCALQGTTAQPSLKIESASPTVAVGGNIEVKCTLVDFTPGHFIYWRKRQGDDPVVLMGTNSVIEGRFKDTGRYTLRQPVTQGTDLEYILEITDVKAEDYGDYGCEIPIGSSQDAYTSVAVPSPVSDIRMFVMNMNSSEPELFQEYGNGAKINFTEGEYYNFMCSASGSNPAPQYQVLLEGEDITDSFEAVPGSEQSTVDTSKPEGLRTLAFSNAFQTKEPVQINSKANTLQLWCYGKTEGTTPLGTYVEAQLFHFAPDLQEDCVNAVRAGNHQRNVVLQCTFRSDPPVHHAAVSWMEGGKKITLKQGERHSHYKVEMVKGDKPDSRKIKLIIDRAFPQHFRSYTLSAHSAHGEVSHVTSLQRDKSLESTQAAGTAKASLLLLGTISSLLAVIYL